MINLNNCSMQKLFSTSFMKRLIEATTRLGMLKKPCWQPTRNILLIQEAIRIFLKEKRSTYKWYKPWLTARHWQKFLHGNEPSALVASHRTARWGEGWGCLLAGQCLRPQPLRAKREIEKERGREYLRIQLSRIPWTPFLWYIHVANAESLQIINHLSTL